MRQLLIQMAYSVPLHNMHVLDATLHLHLNATILMPDTLPTYYPTNTLVMLLYFMQPKMHINENTCYEGMVDKHHSVSAVFILLLNGQKYRQEKSSE